MKKILTAVFLVTSLTLYGQLSEGGLPRTFSMPHLKNMALTARYILSDLDTAGLMIFNRENPLPLRYAVYRNVNIDLKEAAAVTRLPDGGTVWRYLIGSGNSRSLQVTFSKYIVPEGAELYLYDNAGTFIRGAFTEQNMRDDLAFVVGDIPGENIIIEYYEPADVEFAGELSLGGIGQAYLDIFNQESGSVDADGYVPVNCREGIEWQHQKHSVCKYTYNDGDYSYMCSGALINNTANDGTPYFLTANHCISSASYASTVVAYFNYENASCTEKSLYTSQTLSGSSLMTTGLNSDYTLLKLTNQVPPSYQPFFAGWDITGDTPESSAGIHHPHGYKKKISVDYDPAEKNEEAIPWDGGAVTPANTHWKVLFDKGITSSGSSGSPLFNEDGRIVGQLHGGSSYDYYGMLHYSWTHPKPGSPSIASFLDPSSTGATTLDGYYPSGNMPDAQFISDFSAVCTGSPVTITGYSAFAPSAWEWSFSPATIEYHNGTSAASQNPMVSFNAPGNYVATLTVTNSAGSDFLELGSFISAGQTLAVEAYPSGLTDSCTCNFTGMTLLASGADAYQWTLSETADDYFTIVNSTSNPAEISLIEGVTLTESTDIDLTVTGLQGTCQSAVTISVPLLAQANDNISNAIDLQPGVNGAFSNKCATKEAGEPEPPHTSCTGQMSWCDEYGTGENIVENSVWFRYVPAENQTVTIYSSGFDNEIAIYRAASAADILAGNYTLVGANDDYSDTNPNPRITSLSLSAGQQYWIQVDGSGGGSTGTFTLNVNVLSGIEQPGPVPNDLRVYPQPAGSVVYIESEILLTSGTITTDLLNTSGSVVYSEVCSGGTGRIEIPLRNLSGGIYLARIKCDERVFVVKIVR